MSKSEEIKTTFEIEPILVIHWDGKLLPDISGKPEIVDRLPIYVSGNGVNKLLGVPKLPNGTGEATANAVKKAVDDWKLASRIRAACFDTTASNTGKHSGCHMLEQLLQKSLLYLPCRHHIQEIVIGAVFDKCLGCSTGPDVKLFVRFKNNWSFIDVDKYQTAYDDAETASILSEHQTVVDEVVTFVRTSLEAKHPRDDYRELLELVLIFLGVQPDRGVRFRQPGAHHRAKWMAKIIYSLKIWMFQQQFHLTRREAVGLCDVNIFVVLVYVKAWFTATNAVSAPTNNLQLLKTLDSYSLVNSRISDTACNKFLNHLWYVGEELIGLSFFADDGDVSIATKRQLTAELLKPASTTTSTDVSLKRAQLLQKDIQSCQLTDLVTANTRNFFEYFEIPQDFLNNDPVKWNEDEDFIRSKNFLLNLTVVNDLAERGVALIEQYNSILTKDED